VPILDVQIVRAAGEAARQGLSQAIADAAASVFGTPAGQTWVRLHEIRRECYAENGGGPDVGTAPVFVQVLRAAVPTVEELAREAADLAAAVARACGRPIENVHIEYAPPAAGRVAFGGKLIGDR